MIVVDDGSTDDTAAACAHYPFAQLIRVPNGGLSAARNVGLHAASGEIVAYVDADVRVDSSWLTYLVQPFVTSDAVAAGGPNVAPPDDCWFAQCVARAPGAPNHVMFDDRIAEHIPGCNFAVRRTALLEIGGFDPIFLRAGDDVDVCWRLQSRGGEIAYSAVGAGLAPPPGHAVGLLAAAGGLRRRRSVAPRAASPSFLAFGRVAGAGASTARFRSSSR